MKTNTITPNELRIGNYLINTKAGQGDSYGNYVIVEAINRDVSGTLTVFNKCSWGPGGDTSLADLAPIPITEEVLPKLGFVFSKADKSNVYKLDYFMFVFVKEGRYAGQTFLRYANMSWKGMGHIQHVHQLQNFFYALTGEELPIKL
jgi:hypothetical protein